MLYTSYMGNLKNINENIKKYSVMALTPDWSNEYIDKIIPELAPSVDTLMRYRDGVIDRFQYEKEYRDTLSKVNIKRIAKKLDNGVLLCTCKVGQMCHRHILADVIREQGIKIDELNVKPKLKDIHVELESTYTVNKCKKNRDKIYVYPDNMIGKGKSGLQVIRDEENTLGIPIVVESNKRASRYLNESHRGMILERLDKLRRYAYNGYTIVFPKDGLGINLNNMGLHSPILHIKLHNYIEDNFMIYKKK